MVTSVLDFSGVSGLTVVCDRKKSLIECSSMSNPMTTNAIAKNRNGADENCQAGKALFASNINTATRNPTIGGGILAFTVFSTVISNFF